MGRKKRTLIERAVRSSDRDRAIAEYVRARLFGRRGDREKAVASAAVRFHAERSTVERALARNRRTLQLSHLVPGRLARPSSALANAKAAAPLLRELDFVRRWIPQAELEERGDLTWEWALQIAREREQLARLLRTPTTTIAVNGKKSNARC